MVVRFWGVRGSSPLTDRDKLEVGGNTSCVEVCIDEEKKIILDAGTGIRMLGKNLVQEFQKTGKAPKLYIFFSHTHWDHIQGFIFFAPIYIPAFEMHLFGPGRANRHFADVFSGQMQYDYWPVKISHLPAKITFYDLSEGGYQLEGIKVHVKRHIHPGIAYTYRIEYDNKTLVYATDTEHFKGALDERVVQIARGANLLIHDAQYIEEEIEAKLGWGHSTWGQAIQVAQQAGVEKLALFHHDPDRTDEACFALEKEAQRIFPPTFLAREGISVVL
ncbi:MAG: MBL fold metallo-hydrolase [Brevinematales bacterium]